MECRRLASANYHYYITKRWERKLHKRRLPRSPLVSQSGKSKSHSLKLAADCTKRLSFCITSALNADKTSSSQSSRLRAATTLSPPSSTTESVSPMSTKLRTKKWVPPTRLSGARSPAPTETPVSSRPDLLTTCHHALWEPNSASCSTPTELSEQMHECEKEMSCLEAVADAL